MTAGAIERLVGRCPAVDALKRRIAQLAPSELRVHVFGETGTGKEQVARALHELSPRRERRFVALNAAGFSDELFTAELFGHARGAFTGALAARDGYVAQAEGGTLFVDEVAEMSPLAQVRLLRFLQEKEYQRLGETAARRADVRVISATNVDLGRRVREGRFREDLLFRLKEDHLVVPPLRERGQDVLVLARHFLRQFAQLRNVAPPGLGPEAQRLLQCFPWPGNVRQLESEMRRLVVIAPGREAQAEDLSDELRGPSVVPAGGLRAELLRHEVRILKLALERHGGIQSRAAAELGITRQALCAKLRRLGASRGAILPAPRGNSREPGAA
ncbi:MAG: sigma 54-interacting transcriptional regulator [Betaproteobacteria bacterium]